MVDVNDGDLVRLRKDRSLFEGVLHETADKTMFWFGDTNLTLRGLLNLGYTLEVLERHEPLEPFPTLPGMYYMTGLYYRLDYRGWAFISGDEIELRSEAEMRAGIFPSEPTALKLMKAVY